MKRRWYGVGIVAVLLVLGGVWFVTTFERVTTKVWVGPSAAARSNPYLAAMRFAERLGLKTTVATPNRPFEGLGAHSALWLPHGRTGLSATRLRALERWIQNGGHAIVEPEPLREVDPLLDRYGVKREAHKQVRVQPTKSLRLPGIDTPIVVTGVAAPALRFSRHSPDIVAASDGDEPTLASMQVGAGRLTIVGGMQQRFENRAIGQQDNAELLRRIIGFSSTTREFVVLRVPRALPLWNWLRDHALPTLTAMVILLLLALANVLPRFGPLRHEPAPGRRQLREHILAAGRFRWTHGGRDGLLSSAREVAAKHIASLHPTLAQMPPQMRWPELAARTGLDKEAVAHAFAGTARNAREFVQIVDTLASMHAHIGRRADVRQPRARPS